MRWNKPFRGPVIPFKLKPSHIDRKDDRVDKSTPTTVLPSPDDQLWEHRAPVLPAPSDADSWQFIITHIWANDIADNLGRIPVGFYIIVEAGGAEQRTENKPILTCDHSMEWDDDIILPSGLEPSSDICLRVCASFEFSPMLGSGETLRTFAVSVAELIEYNDVDSIAIEFSPPEWEPVSPCSLLRVTVERRSRTSDVSALVSNQKSYASILEVFSSLVQITDEGHKNLLRYYKDQQPEDLRRSVICFERVLQTCPLIHHCRAVVLFNLATARLISCQAGITSPDFDVPITLYRDALDLRPVGHPDRPTTLLHLARATVSRFLKWGDESYAEEAKKLIAQVQDLCSVDSYERKLADAMLQECTPDEVANGCTTISHSAKSPSMNQLKDALHIPDQNPQKPGMLNALAFAFLGRFEQRRDMADLDESISAMRKAVELTQESDLEWPLRAICLGMVIAIRFHQSSNMEDLDRSILVLEKVIQHVPDGHPDRLIALTHLGNTLFARSVRLGRVADVHRSCAVLEEALRLVPSDHPNRSAFLSLVGDGFLRHYEHSKSPIYLNKSISLMEESARCTSRGTVGVFSTKGRLEQPRNATVPKAVYTRDETLNILLNSRIIEHCRLLRLGQALQYRFNQFGDHADLNKSISQSEEALKLTSEVQHYRTLCLANLGHTFLLRHTRLRDLSDLYNSTSMLAEAERVIPNDHPFRSRILVSFSLSLVQRFGQTGQIVDVDKSISVEEEAIELIPDHDPTKPISLSGLAWSFLGRFQRLGDLADLEKSTSIMEEVVRLTPEDHLDRARRLTQLAIVLVTRFERFGDLSDLNRSISRLEEAAQLVSDNGPLRTEVLATLCYALLVRSRSLANAADLEKSVFVGEKAVQSFSSSSDSYRMLGLVGVSLLTRFQWSGNLADLEKSASLIEKGLDLLPEDSPGRTAMLTIIGIVSCCRFRALGDLSALRTAILYFSAAARSRVAGHPLEKFEAFKHWFKCAIILRHVSPLEAHQILLEAFECAISLLPQLAWLGRPFKDRYAKLLDAADITRSAVSLAVSLGHTTRAVEWLEHGRCVVWGQLLQLRTPLDDLRNIYPDLADRIERLSNALEHSSAACDEYSPCFDEKKSQGESSERRARRYRELVTERENLLETIQTLPGFERTFLPKSFSQLQFSAQSGPIILLNVGFDRGDALIVMADLDEPVHVPLPDINDDQAEQLRTLLGKLLSSDGRIVSRDVTHRAARVVKQDGRTFSYILSELWIKVVKPVLHALSLTTPGKRTRVFWCPTGPLSFLPIHAAGNYDIPGTGHKVSDFVISSYTPTLSVLLSSSRERTVSLNNTRLLAVSQPTSDGQSRLFGAPIEIEYLRETIAKFPSAHVRLHDSDGNVEGVLDGMEQSDWVHFACHGIQDSESPTDSGLCLADQRRLRLSDIIRLSRPRGGLAFLSACQTATGAVELSEEAVHLSAGMLFAGYSSVIGTMWSIRDSVAPQLAKDVYEQLFRDGRAPDSSEAAQALHNAVERLRLNGAPFIAWVPFIHMGI